MTCIQSLLGRQPLLEIYDKKYVNIYMDSGSSVYIYICLYIIYYDVNFLKLFCDTQIVLC